MIICGDVFISVKHHGDPDNPDAMTTYSEELHTGLEVYKVTFQHHDSKAHETSAQDLSGMLFLLLLEPCVLQTPFIPLLIQSSEMTWHSCDLAGK
ncbi:hypothetical protein Baya_15130 [Bagarius yarrelli]|uniref:Uncharacterized protein n=1 Tax=Bagarius yarrelli TaxID=175774 RepID=A0A556VB29_BAGYA|nr:hypothetical protein Baya_15130 [Bagarius yarrelli]